MLAVVWCVAVLLAGAHANCEICDCAFPIVTCKSNVIDEFIYFYPDTNIRVLIYDSTNLDELPILKPGEFVNLEFLTLIDNDLLPCQEVFQFERNHPAITVQVEPTCRFSSEVTATSSLTTEAATVHDVALSSDSSTEAISVWITDSSWTSPPTKDSTGKPTNMVVASISVTASLLVLLTVVLGVYYCKLKCCSKIFQRRENRRMQIFYNPNFVNGQNNDGYLSDNV